MLVLMGMVWIVLLITFIGRLSDHVGRRPVYGVAAAAMIVLAVPAFLLIKAQGSWPARFGLLTVRFLPESAQVPLNGSQPMVGSARERRELITTSRALYKAGDWTPGAQGRARGA